MTPLDIAILIRVGFDTLENHAPRYEQIEGVFIGEPAMSAREKAAEWVKRETLLMPTYQGWDGETYPMWRIEDGRVLS